MANNKANQGSFWREFLEERGSSKAGKPSPDAIIDKHAIAGSFQDGVDEQSFDAVYSSIYAERKKKAKITKLTIGFAFLFVLLFGGFFIIKTLYADKMTKPLDTESHVQTTINRATTGTAMALELESTTTTLEATEIASATLLPSTPIEGANPDQSSNTPPSEAYPGPSAETTPTDTAPETPGAPEIATATPLPSTPIEGVNPVQSSNTPPSEAYPGPSAETTPTDTAPETPETAPSGSTSQDLTLGDEEELSGWIVTELRSGQYQTWFSLKASQPDTVYAVFIHNITNNTDTNPVNQASSDSAATPQPTYSYQYASLCPDSKCFMGLVKSTHRADLVFAMEGAFGEKEAGIKESKAIVIPVNLPVGVPVTKEIFGKAVADKPCAEGKKCVLLGIGYTETTISRFAEELSVKPSSTWFCYLDNGIIVKINNFSKLAGEIRTRLFTIPTSADNISSIE